MSKSKSKRLIHQTDKQMKYHDDYINHFNNNDIDIECYYCQSKTKKLSFRHLDNNDENILLTNILPICGDCQTLYQKDKNHDPFITIGRQFRFESAHNLLDYQGPCSNIHGHSYFLEVQMRGPINHKTGMMIDYKNVSSIVQKYVIDEFDHKYINNIMELNPTAENMLYYIWVKLEKIGLVKGLKKIILKETEDSIAILEYTDVLEYYIKNKT